MSLLRYRDQCASLVGEIEESLTKEDLDALREDYAALGWEGWARWCRENAALVQEFVESSPSARRKRRQWADPALRRRVSLAAIHHIRRAYFLLEAASSVDSYVGLGYRQMAKLAGAAYLQALEVEGVLWPLEGTSPFGEDDDWGDEEDDEP